MTCQFGEMRTARREPRPTVLGTAPHRCRLSQFLSHLQQDSDEAHLERWFWPLPNSVAPATKFERRNFVAGATKSWPGKGKGGSGGTWIEWRERQLSRNHAVRTANEREFTRMEEGQNRVKSVRPAPTERCFLNSTRFNCFSPFPVPTASFRLRPSPSGDVGLGFLAGQWVLREPGSKPLRPPCQTRFRWASRRKPVKYPG